MKVTANAGTTHFTVPGIQPAFVQELVNQDGSEHHQQLAQNRLISGLTSMRSRSRWPINSAATAASASGRVSSISPAPTSPATARARRSAKSLPTKKQAFRVGTMTARCRIQRQKVNDQDRDHDVGRARRQAGDDDRNRPSRAGHSAPARDVKSAGYRSTGIAGSARPAGCETAPGQ